MNRQKLIILPKLNHCSGDPSRQWFVYYSVRDPRTGKMVRFRHYDGFTGLSEAEKYEHAKQLIDTFSAKLRGGWTPFTDDTTIIYNDHLEYKTVADMYGSRRTGNKTLRSLTNRWLEEMKPGIRHETHLTYKSKLRIFVLWIEKAGAGNNDIATIDNKLISLFFRYLIDNRQLSAKSIKYYRMLLAKVFESFRHKKQILINPIYDIPPCNRINDKAPRPIQREDLDKIKKELVHDPELALGFKFEYYCGMRPGHEIRLLKIKDIDFFNGTIHIDRLRAKNRKDRIVTIPIQFLEELRASALRKLDKEWYIFGRGGHPGPKTIGKNKLSRHFRTLRIKLGLPEEYKLYSGKHTGAIEADNTGKIPFKEISEHLDHADMQTTSIYFRNKKPRLSEAIRNHFPDF